MVNSRFKNEKDVFIRTHISIDTISVTEPGPLHLHEFYELEIILSGRGLHNLNGSLYTLQPGTVYLLTPIDFHSITPKEPLVVLNLSFDACMLSSELHALISSNLYNRIFHANSQQMTLLQFYIDELSKECAFNDNFSHRSRQNLLELLLFNFIRSHKVNTLGCNFNNQLGAPLQYLFNHFCENITLTEVASQCGYTPNYFSKLFREACGTTFLDFLTTLRINYAKMLLLSTSLSASEIAEKCGFSSTSGFFRRFQLSCGDTPANFRKKNNLSSLRKTPKG